MSGIFPEQKTDDEYLSQTNSDIFDIASDGVYVSLSLVKMVMQHNSSKIYEHDLSYPPLQTALTYLHCYADWRKLDIPAAYKRAMAVMNYGEEEVKAMEEEGSETWK